jgi:hypothetical protein
MFRGVGVGIAISIPDFDTISRIFIKSFKRLADFIDNVFSEVREAVEEMFRGF